MLRKKVEIDGREVEFKASAAVPRIYRMKFRRDLFLDLQKIAKSVKKKGKKEDKESSEIPIEDLEMFEKYRVYHGTARGSGECTAGYHGLAGTVQHIFHLSDPACHSGTLEYE